MTSRDQPAEAGTLNTQLPLAVLIFPDVFPTVNLSPLRGIDHQLSASVVGKIIALKDLGDHNQFEYQRNPVAPRRGEPTLGFESLESES